MLAFSATQLPYLPPADASSGPPSRPPPKPVFFVHTDHLGSTQLLTCFGQGTTLGCADRAVYRQYRYDAYGRTKVFNAAGTQLTPGPKPTERLYTGQVWDWNANVYHYVARVYVPELARFTSTDPVREYANPYAYVGWRPTGFLDPDGREMTAADALSSLSFVAGVVGFFYAGAYVTAAQVAIGAGVGGVTAFMQPDATLGSVAGGVAGGGVSGLISSAKTVSTGAKVFQAVGSTVSGSLAQSMIQQSVDAGEISEARVAKDVLVNAILMTPVAYAGHHAKVAKGAQALGERTLAALQSAVIGMSKADSGDDDLSFSGVQDTGKSSSTSSVSSGTGNAQGSEGVKGIGMFTYAPNRYGTPYDKDMSWGLLGLPNPSMGQ